MKAVAHIGVLSALVRAGIKFDMVAGTSAGALVGLFYAAGHDPAHMARVFRTEVAGGWWWRYLPLGKYWRMSQLLRGGGLENIMRRHVRARRFEELPIPFLATSTDLVRGEAVIHERGDVVQAVQASMSLPGIARPVRDGERLLVDGGLLTYLPSEVLKRRGGDIVVGVELASADAPSVDENSGSGALSVLGRVIDMQHRELHRKQLAAADVLISPRLTGMGCADFEHMHAIFQAGAEAGARAVPRILALLKNERAQARCR